MKNKVFYLVALAVGMVFVMSGCKDCDDPSDPDCGNYDPCFGKEEFKPHFKMYDAIKHWSGELFAYPVQPPVQPYFTNYILTEGDTLLTNGVIFIAPEGYDSVWWLIGAEASYRQGKGIGIYFEDEYPENLPIIMVGKRKPNKACFPNEQAIDTVRRFLTLKPRTDTKVTGQWIGAYDTHPNDSFEINIRFPKGYTHRVTFDYFPDRDLSPTRINEWDVSQFAAQVTLTNFWSSSQLGSYSKTDRYGRRYNRSTIMGKVYGNNYQHLKIDLNYYYDSGSYKDQQPLTFNARRK